MQDSAAHNTLRLTPHYQTEDSARALLSSSTIITDTLRIYPPLQKVTGSECNSREKKTWTPGVCTRSRGPRSYGVQVGGQEFRRNRRQLLHTREPMDTTGEPPPHDGEPQARDEQQIIDSEAALSPSTPETMVPVTTNQPSPTSQPLRRSDRTRKPPEWITKYVPL